MKCSHASCKDQATHYVSRIYDRNGETQHADGYACDLHTALVERGALGSPDTIEFEAKELPK